MNGFYHRPPSPVMTVKLCNQMIHCNDYYIDMYRERLSHGYDREINQDKLAEYEKENKRLKEWLQSQPA